MINNNNKNIDNNTTIIFISSFSVLLFIVITCFWIFTYFKWFKGKKLFKNTLIIEITAKPSLIYKNGNNFGRHYK